MQIRLLFVVASLLFIVTGCGTSAHSPNTATDVYTPPSQAATESQGLDIQATSTAATIHPNQTQTAYAHAIATAKFAEQTVVAQYPQYCDLISSPRVFSPNQQWMVELCYSEEDQDLLLTFGGRESKDLWKLFYRNYILPADYLPDGGLSVVHWSNDGRYAYFRSYISGDGGECFRQFGTDGLGLFRLDLQNGTTSTVLPLIEEYGWYGFTFSPTGRRLVYGAYSRDFRIMDIRTGQTTTIQVKSNFNQGDGFLWSTDGLKYFYSTVSYNSEGSRYLYSLRWVDSQSGEEEILLESADHCYKAKEWINDSVLIIESEASKEPIGRTLIEYDLTAKRIISESTATPFP